MRRDLLDIARAGVAAASASRLVSRALVDAPLGRDRYPGPIDVIAAGKAAVPMTLAAWEALGDRVRAGVMATPDAPAGLVGRLEHIVATHPVPATGSLQAGRRALQIASHARPDGCLVVLLSGGASALMASPADDIALEDKTEATRLLLRSGLPIHEVNAVRKHLSGIKGGQLALAAQDEVVTLAISDVVGAGGDTASAIGSGPTVPDPTTFQDALEALGRVGLVDALPPRAKARLERGARGALPETPKPGDPRLAHSAFRVIGDLADALEGARERAEQMGYTTLMLEQRVTGEARDAARAHLQLLTDIATRLPRPACILSGGETTVRVTGTGKGGRNQEFALAMAEGLRALAPAAVLSLGTDGIDGPTDAAGAFADSDTMERAHAHGLGAVTSYLTANDAYAFFDSLGDLLRTGATDTNVGDLQIVVVG